MPFREATLQIVKEILDPATGVAGLVLLLPNGDTPDTSLQKSDMEFFVELEKYLIMKAVAIPVYFIHENSKLKEIVRGAITGRFESSVSCGLDAIHRERHRCWKATWECLWWVHAADQKVSSLVCLRTFLDFCDVQWKCKTPEATCWA